MLDMSLNLGLSKPYLRKRHVLTLAKQQLVSQKQLPFSRIPNPHKTLQSA